MHVATTLPEACAKAARYVQDLTAALPVIHELAEKLCAEAEAQGLHVDGFRSSDGLETLSFDFGCTEPRMAGAEVGCGGFTITRNDHSDAAHTPVKRPDSDFTMDPSLPLAVVSVQETFWYQRDPESPSEPDQEADRPRGRGRWTRVGGEVLKSLVGDEDFVIENALRDVRAFLDGERGL